MANSASIQRRTEQQAQCDAAHHTGAQALTRCFFLLDDKRMAGSVTLSAADLGEISYGYLLVVLVVVHAAHNHREPARMRQPRVLHKRLGQLAHNLPRLLLQTINPVSRTVVLATECVQLVCVRHVGAVEVEGRR